MKTIHIIAVGKDKDAWVNDGISHYTKLLGRWCDVEWTLVVPKRTTQQDAKSVRKLEADLALPKLSHRPIIALSDSGKSLDTISFSKQVSQWQVRGGGKMTFVIGGPYGLDQRVLETADTVVSLSPLTFSHQVVRLVLMEQVYRAFSILHHTDYHK
jgi:23S rRNA (pseudouridine1915-N3)-methyltransferase